MLALGGVVQMCVSGEVYAEYEDVIRRPRFKRDEGVITATLQSIRAKGFWVRPAEPIGVCPAQADYLVTGNLKHYPQSWANTQIVTPRVFLEITGNALRLPT
jgi:hypothetical protein